MNRILLYVGIIGLAVSCASPQNNNNGDSICGTTCHTQYPSHKVRGIIDFFKPWLEE